MGEKMTRMQLKALVKECLVEILQEGLGGAAVPQSASVNLPMSESRRPNTTLQAHRPARVSPLDMPAYSNVHQQTVSKPAKRQQHSAGLAEAIRNESRGNPIMADIFADTAMNTLPRMMSGGDSITESSTSSSKITQQEQFNGTPEQVFGEEVASKWANLAFMDAPHKKMS